MRRGLVALAVVCILTTGGFLALMGFLQYRLDSTHQRVRVADDIQNDGDTLAVWYDELRSGGREGARANVLVSESNLTSGCAQLVALPMIADHSRHATALCDDIREWIAFADAALATNGTPVEIAAFDARHTRVESLAVDVQRDAEASYQSIKTTNQVTVVIASGVIVALFAVLAASQVRASRRQAQLADHDKLKEVQAAQTRMLSVLAHELNTPMTPLMLHVETLERTTIAADERAALASVRRSVDRLATLVRDTLDVARLQEKKLQLRFAPGDLEEIARGVVESFEPVAARNGVKLRSRIAHVRTIADADRITQVLINLVTNAIKYTPPGGEVTIDVRQDGPRAVVAVRDSGIGLTPDQARRVFEPFSRVHDATGQQRPGTGLGLHISVGIIEQHGGTLTASSDGPGKGSVFTFGLPLAPTPDAHADDASPAR